MRVRVGRMVLWQGRFFDRFVRGMGQRVIERVMTGIFEMTVAVHAGPCLDRSLRCRLLAG